MCSRTLLARIAARAGSSQLRLRENRRPRAHAAVIQGRDCHRLQRCRRRVIVARGGPQGRPENRYLIRSPSLARPSERCSSTTSAEALPCLHRTADFRRTQIAEPPWYVGSSEGGPARCCAMVLRMTGPPNDGLRGAAAPQRAPAGTDGGARRQSVEFRRLRHIGRSRSGRPSRTSPRTAPAMMEGAPGGRGDVGRRGVWGFRLCTSEGGGRGVTG